MGYYRVVEQKSIYETKYYIEYVYCYTTRTFTGWWPFRKWYSKEVTEAEPIGVYAGTDGCVHITYYDYLEQAVAVIKEKEEKTKRTNASTTETIVWPLNYGEPSGDEEE